MSAEIVNFADRRDVCGESSAPIEQPPTENHAQAFIRRMLLQALGGLNSGDLVCLAESLRVAAIALEWLGGSRVSDAEYFYILLQTASKSFGAGDLKWCGGAGRVCCAIRASH